MLLSTSCRISASRSWCLVSSSRIGRIMQPVLIALPSGAKAGLGNNSAGMVRNAAFQHVDTPWVAFVDDDDTLAPNYVS
jgi:hypothetical protein